MSLFKLSLTGHLGHSCKVKDVNGTNAITFSVANTHRFKDKSGVMQERTIWVDCTLWLPPAKSAVAEFLKGGTHVCVVGRPDIRAYISKQNGEPVPVMTLKVEEVHLLGGQKQTDNTGNQEEPQTEKNQSNEQEDDLPF